MNETNISWTTYTINPIHGCSKVSNGCTHCYAESVSHRFGITSLDWTKANTGTNILLQHHKLKEILRPKAGSMVFMCSMSDLFHEDVPDWYRAAIWALMQSKPDVTFQVLTKRPNTMALWVLNDYEQALMSTEYQQYAAHTRHPSTVRDVLQAALHQYRKPGNSADHIWLGTSIESAKHLDRLYPLRLLNGFTRWVSAEPLLGAWGAVDLDGISWVVVGGESGAHIPMSPERVMQMEWALEIKDACYNQNVAFFMKQQSGIKPGNKPYLTEPDGSCWKWQQYPNIFTLPENVTPS